MGRAGDEVGEHRTGAFMGRMEVWTSCCRASRTSAGLRAVAEQNQVFISKSHSDNRAGEEVAYLSFLQTVLTEQREQTFCVLPSCLKQSFAELPVHSGIQISERFVLRLGHVCIAFQYPVFGSKNRGLSTRDRATGCSHAAHDRALPVSPSRSVLCL